MNVISVKPVYEIILDSKQCSEIVIAFECETPLGESDTCAMLARYFDNVYFEDDDNDTFMPKGDIFEMTGVIRVPPSGKMVHLNKGELIIPITTRLTHQLMSQEYNTRSEGNVREMVDNWIGDLFDKKGNLIINK
ncbi:TPA: hypothetical protein OMD89_004026 [Klebsiella oxytoca]|nr:hypothetical protein [Klebsiella oxytoca]HCQ8707768.1 hypothetical protein [Klebsiella oxytoca]